MKAAWLARPALTAGLGWLTAALALALALLGFAARADAPATPPPPDSYARDNARAMDRMMTAMAVAPSGDTDRDFVATMVPHHQGAIDMAVAELRYGRDQTLRRMAQEIIVEQKQEIDAMTLAAARLPVAPPDRPAPAALPTGKSTSEPLHAHPAQEGH